jgi:preprotein translocase subunit YajC
MVNDTQDDMIRDINNKCYEQVRAGTTIVNNSGVFARIKSIQTAPIMR